MDDVKAFNEYSKEKLKTYRRLILAMATFANTKADDMSDDRLRDGAKLHQEINESWSACVSLAARLAVFKEIEVTHR